VTKVSPSGTILLYCGYIGGSGYDAGNGIGVDSSGNAYVTGTTGSTESSFPVLSGPDLTYNSVGDAFVAKISFISLDDFLGTWDVSGLWCRNSDTHAWTKMAPWSHLLAAGDLDGDGTDDLLWSKTGDGVWVKFSMTGAWTKLCSAPAWDMASGDMNGDGRDDLVGNWPTGVYYKNSIGGVWMKMAPLADFIAAGDLDGDGTDDLLWSKAGDGVWVKSSSTMGWTRLTPAAAIDMASGDMNGDGRDDLVGNWPTGTYYKNSIGGAWVRIGPVGGLIGAGNLDGDGKDDLLWSNSGDGVWVKYSSTVSWSKLHATAARHLGAGKMRGGANPWSIAGNEILNLTVLSGEHTEGPGNIFDYVDLSDEGPGGWNFVFQDERNLVPYKSETDRIHKVPGPGEPGFTCIEQPNLVPQETIKNKKTK
jgi:hypothetical protein